MGSLGRQVLGQLPRGSNDAVISSRVLGALESRAPLTVLRGPRGFGKTTAIGRWLSTLDDGVLTVYCPLDGRARDRDGFWQLVATALAASGVVGAQPQDGTAPPTSHDVIGVLDDQVAPLRLVLDNYHEAGNLEGAQTIDDELLEIVRTNGSIDVIVATRSLRALETIGALSVDLTAIRPADLVLSAEAVIDLADSYGLVVTEDEAAHLVLELGGWPAAIRSCLAASAVRGGGAVVDATLVDGFIDTLLSDLRSPALRDFLVRTSVPEEFSAAAAAAIVPGGTAVRDLRNLLVSGILRERQAVAGLRYSYPPAIRDSLARVARERQPEMVREVHLALVTVAAAEVSPIDMFRHAVLAREWDLALRVLDEEWAALTTRHRRELVQLVRRIPTETMDTDARLALVVDDLARMPSSPWAGGSGWSPASPGFLEDAALLVDPREAGFDQAVLPLVQAGAAWIFAGDNHAAAYAFNRVYDLGEARADESRLLGAAGMLMTLAISGEVDRALSWGRRGVLVDVLRADHDASTTGLTELVGVGGRIGLVIASVDGMTSDVHDVVARLVEPRRRDELWALGEYARGLYATTHPSVEHRARSIGRLRSAMRYLEPGGITEATLGTTLVELLIGEQRLDVAAQVLDRLGASYVSEPTRAQLLLAQGRDDEAISTAEQVLADGRLTVRSRHLCETTIAVALHRKGQHTAARRQFDQAVQVARETGQRRIFALLAPTIFAELAGGDPTVLALREAPAPGAEGAAATDTASSRSAQPAREPAARPTEPLSRRERDVLRALRVSSGAVGVAAELKMSVNTAKTHLRNVYRKLGATSRDEALRLASELPRHET